MSLISELEALGKLAAKIARLVDDMLIGDGPRPWLTIKTGPFSSITIPLIPYQEVIMDVTLSVGHTLTDTINYLDQHGNPMLTTPTPDSPPSWSDTTPATETIAVSADGSTLTGTPLVPGTDAISLSVTVGGVVFTATQNVTVTAEPQVLSSVDINPTVN